METSRRDPATARDRLGAHLRARGVSPTDADSAAAILARTPGMMAELLLRCGNGLGHPDGDTPALSGPGTFVAFVVLGIVPLVPCFLLAAAPATVLLSIAATLFAPIGPGLLRWNATGLGLGRVGGRDADGRRRLRGRGLCRGIRGGRL